MLITDGQISNWKSIASTAANCGQRIFTIGVGSAVTEMAVREIARTSKGRCELVAPSEDMATIIHRHFVRLRSLQQGNCTITWSKNPIRLYPEQIDTVYNGDTLHQCAWFDNDPGSEAVLTIALDEHHTYRQQAKLVPWPTEIPAETLPRLISGNRIREDLSPEIKQELALKYRLMSPFTNYCVVIENHQVEIHLPKLRQIRQMMPEGRMMVRHQVNYERNVKTSYQLKGRGQLSCSDDEQYDIPSFLRRRGGKPSPVQTFKGQEFIDLLMQNSLDIEALIECLPQALRCSLQEIKLDPDGKQNEQKAMILILDRMAKELDEQFISRYVAREIKFLASVIKPHDLTGEIHKMVKKIARTLLEKCTSANV